MVLPSELRKVGFQRPNQEIVKMCHAGALSAARKQLPVSSCAGRSADTRRERRATVGVADISATLSKANRLPVAICQFEVCRVLLQTLFKDLELLLLALQISFHGNTSRQIVLRSAGPLLKHPPLVGSRDRFS